MEKLKVGFAVCGSFCTYKSVLQPLERLAAIYDVYPIVSEAVAHTDTRFGKADEYLEELSRICNNPIIDSIKAAEPIGPKKLLDLVIVAPCTGNTLAKLANGITDSTVTMACKAQLRNARPVLLAVSTNDGLGANAESIARLLQRRNIYFVPFGQDGPFTKPKSLLSDMSLIVTCAEAALKGVQVQPILQGIVNP